MCRNIKTLANFEPPATDEEIRASVLQFVRKLSGTARPAKINQAAFDMAVGKIEDIARTLIDTLVATTPPKNRDIEASRSRERAVKRFGTG